MIIYLGDKIKFPGCHRLNGQWVMDKMENHGLTETIAEFLVTPK